MFAVLFILMEEENMKKLLFTIGKCLLFFMGCAIIVGLIPVPNELNPPLWRFVAELIPLLGIIFFTVIFYFVEKKGVFS